MAGVLQGLSRDGRIPVTVVTDPDAVDPAYLFRAMAFDANDNLLITSVEGDLESRNYAGHLPVNSKGMIYASENVPTRIYTGATPINDGDVGTFQWPDVFQFVMPLIEDLSLTVGTGPVAFTGPAGRTYIDKDDGLIKTAGLNEPRFEADGLLFEGPSTNYALFSTDINAAHWSVTTTAEKIENVSAPDGGTGAISIRPIAVPDESNQYSMSGGFVPLPNSGLGQFTYSVDVQSDNGNIQLRFSVNNTGAVNFQMTIVIETGEILSLSFAAGVFAGLPSAGDFINVEPLAGGWFRVGVSFEILDNDDGTGQCRIFCVDEDGSNSFEADGIEVWNAWGFQLEPLSGSTSLIVTGNAPVTRDTEALAIPTENYPTTDFMSSFIDVKPLFQNGPSGNETNAMAVHVQSNTGPVHAIWFESTVDDRLFVGTNLVNLPFEPSGVGVKTRIGITNGAAVASCYANSSLFSILPSVANSFGSIIRFDIGNNNLGISPFYGHLKNLRIYNEALTSEQVSIEEDFFPASGSLISLDFTGPITDYNHGVPYTATGAIAASVII